MERAFQPEHRLEHRAGTRKDGEGARVASRGCGAPFDDRDGEDDALVEPWPETDIDIQSAIVTFLALLGLWSVLREWWTSRRTRLKNEELALRLAVARERLARHEHFKLDELKKFVGGPGQPIVLAISGAAYDVTDGSEFYGPDGPYQPLAGSDASRCLGKGVLEESPEESSTPLTKEQLGVLRDWREFFESKYRRLGPVNGSKDLLEEVEQPRSTHETTATT